MVDGYEYLKTLIGCVCILTNDIEECSIYVK